MIQQAGTHVLNDRIEFEADHQPLHVYQTFFEGLDSVYLLGLLRNPTVPRFEELLDRVHELEESELNDAIGGDAERYLDQIEALVRPGS